MVHTENVQQVGLIPHLPISHQAQICRKKKNGVILVLYIIYSEACGATLPFLARSPNDKREENIVYNLWNYIGKGAK